MKKWMPLNGHHEKISYSKKESEAFLQKKTSKGFVSNKAF